MIVHGLVIILLTLYMTFNIILHRLIKYYTNMKVIDLRESFYNTRFSNISKFVSNICSYLNKPSVFYATILKGSIYNVLNYRFASI